MKIRFLSEQVFERDGPGKGPRFPAGSVLDARDVGDALSRDVSREYATSFLERWVRRGVAEYVDDRAPEGSVPSADDDVGANADGLTDLTVAALKDIAATEAVDLGAASKKEDIIAAIRAARAVRD